MRKIVNKGIFIAGISLMAFGMVPILYHFIMLFFVKEDLSLMFLAFIFSLLVGGFFILLGIALLIHSIVKINKDD